MVNNTKRESLLPSSHKCNSVYTDNIMAQMHNVYRHYHDII